MSILLAVNEWVMIAQLAVSIAQLTTIVLLLKGFFNEMILKIVRNISFFLDKILLNLIDKFYDYFYIILNREIFDTSFIKSVSTSVYVFFGILIFFKLSVTLINYIVNPQLLEDKNKSIEKIMKQIIIGIVAIVAIPFAFDLGLKLQAAILNDKIIEKIVLNDNYQEIMHSNVSQGKVLGFTIFNGFFALDQNNATSSQIRRYELAQKRSTLDVIKKKDLNDSRFNSQEYGYKYYPIISTMALFFVLLIIIKMTLDLGVRIIKLFLLQLIAPFVIASSIIDTNEDNSLKRWGKTALSTYLQVFIKVATLWFLVFFATMISKSDFIVNTNDLLLKSLLFLALFAFVKDAPTIFKDVFKYDEGTSTTKDIVTSLTKNLWGVSKFVGGAVIGAGVGALSGAKNALTSSLNRGIKKSVNNTENLADKSMLNGINSLNKNKKVTDTSKTVKKMLNGSNAIVTGGLKGAISGAKAGATGGISSASKAGKVAGKKAMNNSNKLSQMLENNGNNISINNEANIINGDSLDQVKDIGASKKLESKIPEKPKYDTLSGNEKITINNQNPLSEKNYDNNFDRPQDNNDIEVKDTLLNNNIENEKKD